MTNPSFVNICCVGLINIAKWLQDNQKVTKNYDLTFVNSCINGHCILPNGC